MAWLILGVNMNVANIEDNWLRLPCKTAYRVTTVLKGMKHSIMVSIFLFNRTCANTNKYIGDMNSELVRYSNHHLFNGLVFRPSFEYRSVIQMPGFMVQGTWIENQLNNKEKDQWNYRHIWQNPLFKWILLVYNIDNNTHFLNGIYSKKGVGLTV